MKIKLLKMCVNNKLSELSCPTGLLFDVVGRKCNYDYLVSCSESTTTYPSTITSGINIIKIENTVKINKR